MAAQGFIDINHVYFKYPKSAGHILEDINFSIDRKTITVVSGPSGSGKSTLLKMLIGLIPHSIEGLTAGEIKIVNKNTHEIGIGEIAQRVGCVFQNPEFQLYESEVHEEFPFRGKKPEDIDHPMFHVLDVKSLYYRRISELSSGEKQKVAITSILVRGQEILLMDEPLATLDQESCSRLIESLVKLRDETGRTIIIIEHRWRLLAPFADKIVWIEDGKVSDIQTKPFNYKVEPLHIESKWVNQDKKIGEDIVHFDHVHCKRGTNWVLHDITFAIKDREILGVVGPNGAGKSTISFLLSGVLKPAKGNITFRGKKPKSGTGNVGISFQNPTHQLFIQSVFQEVDFAQRNFKKKFEYQTHEYLKLVNIDHLRDRNSSEISFGEQRRTSFAASLSYEPELCILDEPTTGLDDKNINRLIDFIFQLRSLGRTFLVVSHDERFIETVCDRVIQIREGRLIS